MTAYVGVDPDTHGAIAVLRGDRVLSIHDAPFVKTEGSRGSFDLYRVAQIINSLPAGARVAVEAAPPGGGMKRGSIANWWRGYTQGMWHAALSAEGYSREEVHPGSWKARMGLTGKNHKALVLKAKELFPELAGELSLAKHHGRAAALLIAEDKRRREVGTKLKKTAKKKPAARKTAKKKSRAAPVARKRAHTPPAVDVVKTATLSSEPADAPVSLEAPQDPPTSLTEPTPAGTL